MKNVQVTINPTEIRHFDYTNAFNKKPGEQIQLQVRSSVDIKLNPNNPVIALVIIKVVVEDAGHCACYAKAGVEYEKSIIDFLRKHTTIYEK